MGEQLVRENVRKMHSGMDVIEVSCNSGVDLDRWLRWIEQRRRAAVEEPASVK